MFVWVLFYLKYFLRYLPSTSDRSVPYLMSMVLDREQCITWYIFMHLSVISNILKLIDMLQFKNPVGNFRTVLWMFRYIDNFSSLRKRAFLKGVCFLLPEVMLFFVDMLQVKAWIIYMTPCFSCIFMYIWIWIYKKISIFYPINLNKSLWSNGIVEKQQCQS